MVYAIYSHELEGFLVMGLQTRADAEKWRRAYLDTRYNFCKKMETLSICAMEAK